MRNAQFGSENRSRPSHLWLIAALMAAWGLGDADASGQIASKRVRDAHVSVQALSDRKALVPGESLQLAVSLKTDKDWHIYWQSPGGTGLPTTIRWSAPDGFEVSPTHYPTPTAKYDKILKENSYVHEGEAVFLTNVKVPLTVRVGSEVTFKAEVRWLACKGNCIPGRAELTLSLPIVSRDGPKKQANKELFESARLALPTPGSKAEHIKLKGSIAKGEVKPGDSFTATLTAVIAPKHHMQSHKPLQDYLIPAFVFVGSTEGFDIKDVRYPKAHKRQDKMLGKLSEYEGAVSFEIPIEVDEDADNAPRTIHGVFQYQICTDAGTCYRPEHVTFEIPVQMAGGPSAANTPTAKDNSSGAETNSATALKNTITYPPVSEGGSGSSPSLEIPDGDTTAASSDSAMPVGDDTVSDDRSFLIRAQDWLMGYGFLGVIIAGMLGGLILNIMPCVLPVISLKVLSFVRQAHEDRWRIFRLGLTYSAGIMFFFGVLAGLFFWKGTGWGELFQHSIFIIIMSAVVTAFGLSLFGVFAMFTPKIVNDLEQKVEGEGYLSAFSTGVLATVLGTACTAPFLSAAIAYATHLPTLQGTSIFLAVGFGMALPIIVLTYKPDWLRFVPKPGPWMGVFENLMGFMLFGTVIWLLNPLPKQIGGYGLLLSLIFILSVAIAVWIKGRIEFGDPMARKAKLYILAAMVMIGGWLLPFNVFSTIEDLRREHNEHEELYARGIFAKYGKDLDWSHGIPWLPYLRDEAMKDVREGFTIFVDYTASWCASCKANKAAFINRPEVIQVMRELNVIPYEADFSNYNKVIKADLNRFDRAGVPMYLIYKPGDTEHPEVLPEFLTKQTIISALRRAGPSHVKLVHNPG